jgi:hypothetical protein
MAFIDREANTRLMQSRCCRYATNAATDNPDT